MGFKTKVPGIERRESQQGYIHFSSAWAQRMNVHPAEVVEGEIPENGPLVFRRRSAYRKPRHA